MISRRWLVRLQDAGQACYNQRMLRRITDRIEKHRSQSLLESVQVWYSTSQSVCDICGEALHDQALIQADIGTVLDKADRKLMQYRNDSTDAQRAVRRHSAELARRVKSVTQQVYELRNLTAKFLIRAQGPSPFAGGREEGDLRVAYYQRALSEAGFQARDLKTSLDQELRSIWPELDKLLRQAEKALL